MKVKRFDNGGEADSGIEATEPASTFYDTYAKDPTANYVPSGSRRSVGSGVAVQEAPQVDFSRFGLGDVSSLYSNLLGREADPGGLSFYQEAFGPTIEPEEIDRFLSGAQGTDLPSAQTAQNYLSRTGDEAGARMILEASAGTRPLTRDILSLYRPEATSRIQDALSDLDQRIAAQRNMQPSRERQQQFASYAPGSLESMLATGYNQLFGRDLDPTGAQHYLNQLGGQNLDQAAVNRYLLGGAQGGDRTAAEDYELSLIGGRPDYQARMAQGLSPQYMQPVYRSSYQDYLQPRTPTAGLFSPGFNPFNYAAPPSDARLGQIQSALNPFMSATPAAGPTASFNTYTGYNPFDTKAVNPYATRASRPVGQGAAVQPQVTADLRGKMASAMPNMPQQPSPQVPVAQPETLNPFARSVGEGVAVQLPQPANESYLRAYAKGGGIGF